VKTKTLYFDYENEWKINEMNTDESKFASQIENELILPPLPIPNESSLEASENLSQEKFEEDFAIGSIHTSDIPQ